MSRRYGRKQRRAAREMILDLACTNRMLRDRVNDQMAERNAARAKVEFLLDRIRLWDNEIRALLGPYTSFAIDDTTFRVDHPDQIRQMQVAVIPPLPPLGVMSASAMPETLTYYVETMLGFMCGLDERNLERLRRLLTVRVMVGGDYPRAQAYYAVSEQTWNELKRAGPDGPGVARLIDRVASDLVRLLAAPPKKPERAARPDMRKPTGHSRDWMR